MEINPFYWHQGRDGHWRFGDYWITDFLGGLMLAGEFIFIAFLPFWIGVIIGMLIIWLFKIIR